MTHTLAVSIAGVVGVVLFVGVRKLLRSRVPNAMVANVVAAVIAVGGCAAALSFLPSPGPAGPIEMTTCPDHNFIDALWHPPGKELRKAFTIVGTKGMIPEYHDCQKLIAPGSTGAPEYGPTVAIFETSYGSQSPTQTDPVIAVVFTMGNSYPALGINLELNQPNGINCLYLTDSTVGQHAKMVGPISQDDECTNPANKNSLNGTPLWVLASSPNPNVPPVARWDYDPSAKLNYIGIKCGANWCEIGRDSGSKVSSTVNPSSLTHPGLSSTVAVKGWYDQQPLADPAGNGMKISDVTGTLIPVPGLGAMGVDSFKIFAEVAVAIVDKPYKMDLEPGENTVSLCNGDLATCAGKDPTAVGPTGCVQGTWLARIKTVVASGPPKTTYHCVNYTEHTTFGAQAPGTARWRWVANDERMWMRCSTGCCEVY